MKKILIVGEKYSSNLGDGIIVDIVKSKFAKNFEVYTLDLSGKDNYLIINNDKSFNIKEEKSIYYKNKIRKILNNLGIDFYKNNSTLPLLTYQNKLEKMINDLKINTIIIAGGQMFMNCFINQILTTVEIASKKNISVIFNACGIGKIYGIKNKNKLLSALNNQNVKYISIRDNYKYFNPKDVVNDIVKTFDTAILCENYYGRKKTTQKIGIGIMVSHTLNIKKQISFWKNMITLFKNSNLNWEIFCNGNESDYQFAVYLLKELGINKNKICKKPGTPTELVDTITKYNKIISMRLHSLIIAYSYNIPAIAISWDKKVNDFYENINQKKYCFSFDDDTKMIFKHFNNINNNCIDQKRKKIIIDSINKNINNIEKIIT